MRGELAERVYPVLQHALELRDRLERGERPSLAIEQSTFLGLLGVGSGEGGMVDYDGDRAGVVAKDPPASDQPDTAFLGARYALVCWLDELFVFEAPWSEQWNEHKLEVSLYASNDRAWRFWSQARLAASRGLVDALEVFYLCAMLGFRGDMRDQPTKLKEWFEAAGQHIRHAQSRRWVAPLDLAVPAQVPVLRGRRNLRVLLMATSLSALLLVPMVIVFFLRAAG